jgi:hypothetical protein
MPSLRESTTAVVIRGEHVGDGFVSEPYEAGWAIEAVLFLRLLQQSKSPVGHGRAHVEISPDGMYWAVLGEPLPLPTAPGEVAFRQLGHFGNWLRVRLELPAGAECQLLATLHLKG